MWVFLVLLWLALFYLPKKVVDPPAKAVTKVVVGERLWWLKPPTPHLSTIPQPTLNSTFNWPSQRFLEYFFLNELEQYFFSVNYGFWSICCKIRGVQLNVSLDQPFDSIQGCNFINCVAQIQTRFWCRYIATNQMSKIGVLEHGDLIQTIKFKYKYKIRIHYSHSNIKDQNQYRTMAIQMQFHLLLSFRYSCMWSSPISKSKRQCWKVSCDMWGVPLPPFPSSLNNPSCISLLYTFHM